jgi:hypothetical protein
MSTLQVGMVCLTALIISFFWLGVCLEREKTKCKSIASQERVYQSVRQTNSEVLAAVQGASTKQHEVWCDSLDGKRCNCHFSRE